MHQFLLPEPTEASKSKKNDSKFSHKNKTKTKAVQTLFKYSSLKIPNSLILRLLNIVYSIFVSHTVNFQCVSKVCVRSFPKSHIFQLLISLLAFHFHMTGCALESHRRAVQWVPDRNFGPCLLVDIGKLKQIVLPKVMPVIDA